MTTTTTIITKTTTRAATEQIRINNKNEKDDQRQQQEQQQQKQRRLVRPLQLDVSAEGGPEGVTLLLQKLKMRSGITTISVNFPTFPANQSF